MEHPYLNQYHDPTDEPVSPPLDVDVEGFYTMKLLFNKIIFGFFLFVLFCFILGDLTIEQWKELIWKEIHEFQEERKQHLDSSKVHPMN